MISVVIGISVFFIIVLSGILLMCDIIYSMFFMGGVMSVRFMLISSIIVIQMLFQFMCVMIGISNGIIKYINVSIFKNIFSINNIRLIIISSVMGEMFMLIIVFNIFCGMCLKIMLWFRIVLLIMIMVIMVEVIVVVMSCFYKDLRERV